MGAGARKIGADEVVGGEGEGGEEGAGTGGAAGAECRMRDAGADRLGTGTRSTFQEIRA